MKTLWQKESSNQPDRSFFHEFTTSEDLQWDHHLIPYDILVNIAQARMLGKIRVYDESEEKKVTQFLQQIYQQWESGQFRLGDEDEDVHSAIEKVLTEKTGEAGKRIHTGRSRNDQVLADINLALKSEIRAVAGGMIEAVGQLDQLAQSYQGVFFAGMTHTQPAMPSSVDSWAAGYIRLLLNDLDSLIHSYHLIDESPLGSAAGYGVPHIPIDREFLAGQLGFSRVLVEVNAAQLTRVSSVLRVCDSLEYSSLTINRIASDVIEYLRSGIITLEDSQTSGSSIMPQKRNPDLWELIRSHYHRLAGAGRELGGITANLTSGYHRDLQPVKAIILNALDQTKSLVKALNYGLSGLSFDKDTCHATLSAEVMATHHANRLVHSGVPFREAYRQTASALKEINVPGNDELSKTYSHTGAPGNYPAEPIREQTETFAEWVKSENKKWDTVTADLLQK